MELNSKTILVFSCLFAVIADMLFVTWAKKVSHPIVYLVIGLIFLNVSSTIWAFSVYKGEETSTAITFYSLFTIAGCTLLGYLAFNETLNMSNIIGLFLAIIAIILINK